MPRPNLSRSHRAAFTMLEVILSLLFFTMMMIVTAAVVPMAARSSHQGNDFNQASSLLLHKIDQLQSIGFAQLQSANLVALGVVDSAGTLPTANPNGDLSGAATFTTVDKLGAYFVNAGVDPKGEIALAPYAPSARVSGGGTVYSVIEATVTVSWRDARGMAHSQVMRTLIPKNPLQ